MYRLLIAELRRLFKGRIFRWMVILITGGLTLFGLLLKVIQILIGRIVPAPELLFTMVPTIAPLMIGIFVIVSAGGEFSDGTLRNKIFCGSRRRDILISTILSQCVCETILVSLFVLIALPVGRLLFGPFTADMSDIVSLAVLYILTSAAITVFYTGLQFIIGNSRSVIVVALITALANQTIAGEVFRKLFPLSGDCAATGLKLAVMNIYDRFIPFSYFTGPIRYDASIYAVGLLAFAALCFIVSSTVFERRDIK